MANVNWAWKPKRQQPRKEINGISRVSGSPRSTTPLSLSRNIPIRTGGFGTGIGNNVCSTLRGVNAVEDAALDGLKGFFGRTARKHKRKHEGRRINRLPKGW